MQFLLIFLASLVHELQSYETIDCYQAEIYSYLSE